MNELANTLRMYAEDIHSFRWNCEWSEAMSEAADRLDEIEKERDSLAAQNVAMPVSDDIFEYIRGVYEFLESTCPAGFADEVFRLPPSATSAQKLLLHTIQSNTDGKRMELAQQD